MGKYRAVEIIPEDCTCPLSKFSGHRILLSEFKVLTKNHSINVNCKCRFKHYADRRTSIIDRRAINSDEFIVSNQRRLNPYGRRVGDQHNRARDPNVTLRPERLLHLVKT